MFYGLSSDEILKTHLYKTIGPPHSSKILLLPLIMSGNVIALIYADFGQTPPTPIQTEYLEIVSRHAGLVLDNSLYRKKFDKLTKHP
jgi:GAF domain-containing protein